MSPRFNRPRWSAAGSQGTDGRRPARSSLKVVATLAASAMLVALAGAGASAETSTQQTSSNPLKVTVGKTVALTTNQKGDPTPLNLLLINGQISGQGSGTVQIPTSTTGQKTVDVNSSGGQVQNFFSLAGSYGGQLPVTVATQVTVNGKSLDPDQGFGLNGDVEVNYVFTNHTARQQSISYSDIFGVPQTKTVDVPVPFGSVFSVTFGDGWRIEDPGAMTLNTTPSGSKLSATVVLFPIVKGVGGTTQTLTLKAKAQNAQLPSTNATIVPIDLSTYMGGLALDIVPGLNQKLLTPLQSTLNASLGQIYSAARLISGYTAGFQSISANYINPVVDDVNKINVTDAGLNGLLTQLNKGLTNLSKLMSANSKAQSQVAGLLTALSNSIKADLVPLLEWLGKVVVQMGPDAGKAAQALTQLNSILGSPEFTQLGANTATVAPICNAVDATSQFYGYAGGLFGGGQPGANAVVSALKGTTKPWTAGLRSLQGVLNNQSSGNLLPQAIYSKLGLIPQKYDALVPYLEAAACKTVDGIAGKYLAPIGAAWNPVLVADLAASLKALSNAATDPEVKQTFAVTLDLISKLADVLNNDSCASGDIINPILAALKKYGVAGIKSHIREVVIAVLGKCGLAQIVNLLADADQTVAKASSALGTTVTGAQTSVPEIVRTVDKVKGVADLAGRAFGAIPGAGSEIANAIAGAGSKVGGKADAGLAEVSDFAAQLNATLLAMNKRTLDGDGAPYGNATGPGTQTITAYQITQQQSAPYTRDWTAAIIMAIICLLIAIGGTAFFYRRRRRM